MRNPTGSIARTSSGPAIPATVDTVPPLPPITAGSPSGPMARWVRVLEAFAESGIPGAFHILKLYLTHFRGQRSAFMQFMAPVAGTLADAWAALTSVVGINGVDAGTRWTAPAGAPALGEPRR